MPSSSKKQHNFMAAVAHSKSFARKVGVPQSVGKDFTEADKGRKMKRYGSGGKVNWSENEANAMKPGEKQLGYGKPKAFQVPPKSSKGKGSFNRDSITAEGRAKGVNFDKYGRVKAPSSVASDMVKKGAKFALDASPFGGIRKAGESVKKFLTTKSTKRPANVGKGEGAYRNDTSDLVDRAFKSGAKPGTAEFSSFIATNGGRDSADNKKTKKYAGGGHVIGEIGKGGQRLMKANWNTWEPKDDEEKEEKSTAPSYGADEEAGEEAKENIARSERKARREADTQHRTYATMNADGEEEPSKEQTFKEAFAAAKGKNFTWKGKEYSGATKKSDSSAASPPKSHRTTGAGSKSYQAPKSTASTSSRFLANAEKDKKGAAEAALKRNPKLSAPKDEPLQEVHPEDWVGVGKAAAGLGTAAYAAKKFGPSILKNMTKIESAVGKRAARGARSEAFINETARKRAVARPLKQAQSSRKAAHAKYEADNKEAYRGMKRGGAVSRYCGGGMTKRYAAGGAVSSVSSRADGIASRGRTKCKIR